MLNRRLPVSVVPLPVNLLSERRSAIRLATPATTTMRIVACRLRTCCTNCTTVLPLFTTEFTSTTVSCPCKWWSTMSSGRLAWTNMASGKAPCTGLLLLEPLRCALCSLLTSAPMGGQGVFINVAYISSWTSFSQSGCLSPYR